MEPKPRRGLAMFLVAAIFLVPFSIAVSVWSGFFRATARTEDADAVVELTEEAVQVAGNNNEFALALYQQLRTQEGNLFFSPHSLSTAMAMSYAGAAGTTKTEIANTFHFELPEPELHAAMQNLQEYFALRDQTSGVELRSANHLWSHPDTSFLPEFQNVIDAHYGAELSQLDFMDAELARNTINDWVAERTAGKVTDIVAPGVLSPETTLVLANAVYFKGAWKSKFDESETESGAFFVSRDKSVDAKLMHQTGTFHIAIPEGRTESGLKMLELPYVGNGLAMFVLLPNSVDGLSKLEAELTEQKLTEWLQHNWAEKFDVWLPKFQATSQFDLAKTLRTMGMPSAFELGQADFSRIAGTNDIAISSVLHKACIDVNEEGTEAAAATAGPAMKSAEPTVPLEFRADHPFLYFIRDNESGAILFMGRMIDPTRG